MSKKIFQIIFSLLFFLACKQENKQKDTFTKYPSVPCRDSSYINCFIKPSEKYLNLQSLENGVDSFEMRIYINGVFMLENEVYVLKLVGSTIFN